MSPVDKARSILAEVMSKANDVAIVSDAGIESLVRVYMTVNTICQPAGHYRVAEGSEHYLFYALEKRLQKSFIHGHIVGLGVYVMSRLQCNKPQKVLEFMETVGLKYLPVCSQALTVVSLFSITHSCQSVLYHSGSSILFYRRTEMIEALLGLGEFVRSRSDLWYTVIDDPMDIRTGGLFSRD